MRLAFTIFPLLIISSFASAQNGKRSLDDLNREKAKLQSIIEQNNKMMDEYKMRKNNEMMRISVVDSKITRRRQLLVVYHREV